MSPRKRKPAPAAAPVVDAAERRAEDQDAAVEEAFVAATLPEEDRRESVAEPPVAPNVYVGAPVDPDVVALASAGVGSVFEKTATGWNVKYVDGGTVIHVQGATIADAIGSHGAQREHPKTREQLAREAAHAG